MAARLSRSFILFNLSIGCYSKLCTGILLQGLKTTEGKDGSFRSLVSCVVQEGPHEGCARDLLSLLPPANGRICNLYS